MLSDQVCSAIGLGPPCNLPFAVVYSSMLCARQDIAHTLGCALAVGSQHGLHAGETVARVLSMILVGKIAIQSENKRQLQAVISRLERPQP